MSRHRLSTAQAEVAALIEIEIAKPTSPIYGLSLSRLDFGQKAPEAAVNRALGDNDKGLCIICGRPYAVRVRDEGNQVARLSAVLRVFIFENSKVNTTPVTGANKNPLECVEAIWNAVARAPSKGPQFRLGQTPMDVIEEGSGFWIYPMEFECEIIFAPN